MTGGSILLLTWANDEAQILSTAVPPLTTSSVAMCTCQGETFLRAQLASIAGQTRPPDELIICDDASTDRTVDILRNFAEQAPFPTRIHVNAQQQGTTKNFEKATALCSGKLIFFADQDDVWHPDKLERLTAALTSSRAGLAFSNVEVVNQELVSAGYSLWQFRRFSRRRQRRAVSTSPFTHILGQGIASGMSMGFRAELLDLIMPFGGLSHDLWVSTLISATDRGAVLVPDCLAKWRQHASQQTGAVTLGTLGRQLSESMTQDAAHFFDLAQGYTEVLDRLMARRSEYPCSEAALSSLRNKIDHLLARARMRTTTSRIPVVVGEVVRGRYWRYSYGSRTVLKDLML